MQTITPARKATVRSSSKTVTLTITRRRIVWGKHAVVFYDTGKASHVGRGNVLSCISSALRRAGI